MTAITSRATLAALLYAFTGAAAMG